MFLFLSLTSLLWLVTGNHLCDRYRGLYSQAYNDLKWWYRQNVTAQMMDRAIDGYTMQNGEPGFAFLIDNHQLFFHTDLDKLRDLGRAHAAEITYMMEELSRVVEAYGSELPNVEMVVMVDDAPNQELRTYDSEKRARRVINWAPIGKYFSTEGYAHVAVPGWGYKIKHFDDKLIPWSNTTYARYPWATREASLYGNYESVPLAAERETGESWATKHPRAYVADYVSTHHPTTIDVKRKREGGLREHAQHKYLAAIDGVGPSNRYYELLLTGSLVFKMKSPYKLHFEGGMKPFMHYVPWWVETPWDAHDLVLWARENDALAKRIAENGRRFAVESLAEPARLCYWRELLIQMGRVMDYVPTVEGRKGPRPVSTYKEAARNDAFKAAYQRYG